MSDTPVLLGRKETILNCFGSSVSRNKLKLFLVKLHVIHIVLLSYSFEILIQKFLLNSYSIFVIPTVIFPLIAFPLSSP